MSEEIKQYIRQGKKNLILIYILYLAGFVMFLLPLIGATFAYINKDDVNNFLRSHYIFAVRTFYIGTIWFIISFMLNISFITIAVLIGLLLKILVLAWCIVRVVIALQHLGKDEEHPNPMTFWLK